ncbi:MAG TPA: metallopeptidase TldD-related protein [Gemmatimonadota bacterium]|nr:metallopeptidase TldD-related protein [Gemmatimonadota bacterium]
MPILTEEEARRVVGRVLDAARADAVEVSVGSRDGGNTRFANNGVTTAGQVTDVTVAVTASFGTRSGAATTNGLDDDGLVEVVRRAEAAARLAPEDPEHVEPLEPVDYPEIEAFHPATAGFGPAERAEVAAAAIGEAVAREAVVAGFLESWSQGLATANSAGLFGYHPQTWLEYTNTVRTPDGAGSGWAGVRLHDAAGLDAAARARIAAEKAIASRDPRPLEPGDWPVILEPAAVAVMAGALVGQMDARRAMEGRSYLSAPGGGTRLGETLLAPSITIETDPAHAVAPGRAWASQQLPARRTVWFREGTVDALQFDRHWAREQGEAPLPTSTNLILHGGEGSLEDLIRGTARAVLVTRFWYIRSLNPRDLTLTGLTRDGTFLVEDGRIAHAVNNFRWNESPVRLFAAAEAMSRSERVSDEDWGVVPSFVPALRASSFHFSSVSQAV